MKIRLYQFFMTALLTIASPIYSGEYHLVFIQSAEYLPPHQMIAMEQAALFNPSAHIHLLTTKRAAQEVPEPLKKTIDVHSFESIPMQAEHRKLLKREGASPLEKFFYLADLAAVYESSPIIYIANEMMLYKDLSEHLPIFKSLYSEIAATFDNDSRCQAGLIYFKDHLTLQSLTKFLSKEGVCRLPEQRALSNYQLVYGSSAIDHLPVTTPEYIKDGHMISLSGLKSFDEKVYQKNIKFFLSIFDGKALGDYFSGVNERGQKVASGYVNPDSLLNPRLCSYLWERDAKGRIVPYISYKEKKYPINNLYIGSKELEKFTSHREELLARPIPQ